MISTVNVGLQYSGRELFKGVDIKFTNGNCYGLIGANGAGKSTFLKILSGEIEPQKGQVIVTPGERISVLRQDHFAFDAYDVIKTVLLGNPKLCEIMDEKKDSLRFYYLGEKYRSKIEHFGVSPQFETEGDLII